MTTVAKDDVLANIADRWNVAQFASFGPGTTPRLRRHRMRGDPGSVVDVRTAAEALLARSVSGTVNVRSFTLQQPKGNPFHYGLASVDDVAAHVLALAERDLFTIINETIDVDDGGVSGVRLGEVIEFAPGGTPRVVEEPGIASMRRDLAEKVVSTVYGTALPQVEPGARVEFSVHPIGVGVRGERTIVWEVETVDDQAQVDPPKHTVAWPNRFSEHLGDKAFGLIVADALGLPVPATQVVARSVPPYSFGRRTRHDGLWVRTAPRRFAAGRYTTVAHWIDPFELLAREDPAGDAIGAVLVQESVGAGWSGAARCTDDEIVIEGVAGSGAEFMLGDRAPEQLPAEIHERVRVLCRTSRHTLGPVRLEWGDDGEQTWVLQLNQTTSPAVVEPRAEIEGWLDYDPLDGLDVLRTLIGQALQTGAGINVTRPVGLTSHVGDLIRQSFVPSMMTGPIATT